MRDARPDVPPGTVPLARASTLAGRYYLDRGMLERERTEIFGRTWQLVAHRSGLARPGDFVPVTILDEPVVITHGLDGVLRGFFNVCRHRAGKVALTKGNRRSLQCRYHGWTYDLDGRLRAAPEMEATLDFDPACFGLSRCAWRRSGPSSSPTSTRPPPPWPPCWARSPRRPGRPASTSMR